jgi:RNA polymerase sigma-70 factor (ECF subfamily)
LRRVSVETLDAAALDWPAVAAAFRAGDAAAAEVVATRLAPFVAQLVRRLTAWRGDAEDIAQDVLVSALAAREKFRGDAKLETWITRIAVNACRAHARKQWLRRRLYAAWAGRRPGAAAPAADEATEIDEQARAVGDAVGQLPSKYREAIVLCYLQKQTPAEAAEALGLARGTVEVRLSRARRKLRELL